MLHVGVVSLLSLRVSSQLRGLLFFHPSRVARFDLPLVFFGLLSVGLVSSPWTWLLFVLYLLSWSLVADPLLSLSVLLVDLLRTC